jgi:uncharacterized membrane protein YeaQ/YmgE (transglycosylase-associated protein family)
VLILGIIVLGMVAGAVAQLAVGGGRRINWPRALVVGLIGSFVGGLLASLIAGDGLNLRPSGLIGSIVGATVVSLIAQAISGTPARGRHSPGRQRRR